MTKRQRLANAIRATLDQYEIGDQLPTVAELMDAYDSRQNTTIKAMHVLMDEGLVESETGANGGYFLVKLPGATSTLPELTSRLQELLEEASNVTRQIAALEVAAA